MLLTIPMPSAALWIRDPPNGKDTPTTEADWDAESIIAINDVVATQGPFWAILGYSQGTAMLISYLANVPSGTFQVALAFCAYIPTTHEGLVARIDAAAPFSLPTFIFMGEHDSIITNAMTDEYATKFSSPTRCTSSEAGHAPPQPSDPTYNDIFAFMDAHQGTNTAAPSAAPTPPTAAPTPAPTNHGETHSPTPGPTSAPTAAAAFEVSLTGITAAQFDSAAKLSFRTVIAVNAGAACGPWFEPSPRECTASDVLITSYQRRSVNVAFTLHTYDSATSASAASTLTSYMDTASFITDLISEVLLQDCANVHQ